MKDMEYSAYLVQMQENADQNNSEYGDFSRIDQVFLSCHNSFFNGRCLKDDLKKVLQNS